MAPAQITLSRPVLAGFCVFAVLMLGLLAAQIVLLSDQLRTVRTQRAIAQEQAERAFPLLDAVRPLVGDTRASLPGLRRGATRLDHLMRNAAPLVTELRAARAPEATRATLALASTLLQARVGDTTDAVRALSVQLTDADVGPAVAALAAQLEEAERHRLVAHLDEAARTAPRLDRRTRRLLATQLDALAVLKESLAIQRETLRHAESIDRKTGPPPPHPPVSTSGP